MRNRALAEKQRKAAQAARVQASRDDKSFHTDAVIRRYEEALKAAGLAPQRVEYNEGWYVVHAPRGRFNYREVDIARKTQALWAGIHAREIETDSV